MRLRLIVFAPQSTLAFAVMPRTFHFAVLAIIIGCGRSTPLRYDQQPSTTLNDAVMDGGLDKGPLPCVPGRFKLEHAAPVVMLVLDRSQSMRSTFSSSAVTKWNALRAALRLTLPSVDQSMELGALIFPSANATCGVSSTVNLVPAKGQVDTLTTLLDNTEPSGSTPTAIAIDVAASSLLVRRTAGTARALVLATDGAPDCNSALTPGTCTCISGNSCSANRCLDDVRTAERLSTAARSGVPTYVIGIQNSSDATLVGALNRMAIAGGRPRAGAQQYYAATSSAELNLAFSAIRDQVGACVFLTSSVPRDGGGITVLLNGARLELSANGLEGWAWADRDNGELVLLGQACAAALAHSVDLEAVVACPLPDAGSQ